MPTDETKLHELEKLYLPNEAKAKRIELIKRNSGISLDNISETCLDAEILYKKNIENFIGSVEIPIGVAGPVLIKGDFANGEFYIPLATTEGTLVASTNRGASVTRKSGGIVITSEFIGITRAPLYRVKSIRTTKEIQIWVKDNFELLSKIVVENEKHLKLLKIEPYSHGRNLWLKMFFNSDEAMGMNMATKAAYALSQSIIKSNKDIELLSVSGNMCTDKKPSSLNMTTGRGRRVKAECLIEKEIIEKYFRTTAKKIAEVNKNKIWEGSAMSGGFSFNAHFANIIAACFAATGQDLGHIVDSSLGYCTMEDDDGDLYASITLPCMIVGVIGGGTNLPKQKQAQDLILTELNSQKLITENKSDALAEVIASAVLCSELSLHAALATNEHIKAHEEYGRSGNGKD